MPQLDLSKLTAGLSGTWAGFLRDWDRSLRAGNYPETTRYNYLLAAAQLGRYLAEYSPDPDADDAAEDPAQVTRGHVESFQGWMIQTRSAATALNKHKGLQQFFKWLTVEEQEIDRSPMDRVRQPKTPQTPWFRYCATRTSRSCSRRARARGSCSYGTRRSSGSTTTPALACPRLGTCCSTMST